MTRIGENSRGQFQLGLGQGVGAGLETRNPVVAGVEPVRIGCLQALDHGLGAGGHDAFVEPNKQMLAVLVKGLNGRSLFLVAEDLVDLRIEQIVNFFGDRPISRIECRERIRRGLRRWRSRSRWP